MKVFSNLAISLDGKIADLRTPPRLLGSPADKAFMEVLRKKADVILVGASTLRVHSDPVYPRKKTSFVPAGAIVTRSGAVPSRAKFWSHSDQKRFIFTTQKGFKRALLEAQDRAFVYNVDNGKGDVDLFKVLKKFKEFSFKNVLVEGGGELVASFLKAKLLSEMYVTLTPWLIGGSENPSLAGRKSQPQWQKLKLIGFKRLASEIYLHYKVLGSKNV